MHAILCIADYGIRLNELGQWAITPWLPVAVFLVGDSRWRWRWCFIQIHSYFTLHSAVEGTSDMAVVRLAAADSRRTTVVRRARPCSCTARRDAVDAARRSTRSRASARRCAGRRRTYPVAAGSAWLGRWRAPHRTAARTCWRAARSSSPASAPDGNSSLLAPPTGQQYHFTTLPHSTLLPISKTTPQ